MAQSKEWSVTPGNKESKTVCFDVRLSDVTTTTFTNKGQQITIITSNRFDNIFIYNFALFKKLFWLLRHFYHTWVTRVSLIPKKNEHSQYKTWIYNLELLGIHKCSTDIVSNAMLVHGYCIFILQNIIDTNILCNLSYYSKYTFQIHNFNKR